MTSFSYHQQIEKEFQAWNLPFNFSQPVLDHLLHFVRQDKFTSIIEFVHTAAIRGVSLEQVKNDLQVA